MRKWSFGRPPRQNRAPKSKSRSKPKPRPQPNPRPSPPNPSLDHDDSPALTPLERHARKCSVCSRPHREHIEEAFLQWRSPDTIMRRWDIKTRTANYHHAHAFNLFALRNRNLQWPRGNIIEDADTQGFRTRDIFVRHPRPRPQQRR